VRAPVAALTLVAAALAVPGGGCGSSGGESAPPQAHSQLPAGRKLVIFEPGPVALASTWRDQALDQVVELGVNTVRLGVLWSDVAPDTEPADWRPADPADPHYDFSLYDGFMRAAEARNLKVLVTISGPGPPWTTRTGIADTAPDPGKFGAFASAVASRYSGHFDPDGGGDEPDLPGASMWSVWNEPNLSIFLKPQLRNGVPYSPILYRQLYLAAQSAIEAGDPGSPILIGETAPTRGLDGVDPIPFARGVLCLDPIAAAAATCRSGHIDAAGWATHPYSTRGTPPFVDPPGPDFVTLPSLANLELVLDQAADAGRLAPALPVYISEYGIQSKPDPTVGIPLETQAEYLSISEQLAYADPRIRSYAQYLMRDDPPDRVPGFRFGGFESGLRFWNGPKKPSYDSFRLPLVVRRSGDRVSIWGLVRPATAATSVEIRVQDGGRTKHLENLKTSEAGIFSLESAYLQGRLWQVRWRSPSGESFSGPWTRAYSFALPQAPG
jgi:hypothetical protein